MRTFLVLLSFAASLLAGALAFECTNFDSNMGAHFDLSELSRAAGDPMYSVIDGDLPCTAKVEANYTYIFNVCGTVGTSAMPDKCKTLTNVGQASALQINTRGTYDQSDDYCFMAGEYSEVMTKVSLLNQEDPTKGIQVSYAGGRCSNGDQRMFNIEMGCMDKLNPVATHALEYSHCVYTVTMPSIYGCPLECPVSNRHLCGGNGHCAYDDDKHAARCFCNNGYTGADCSKTATDDSLNYSPALLGLIITLFIIVCALAAGLLFMVRQIAAYKDDMAHYEVLKGGEDESSHGGVVV